jgi:hypothetical protein
MSVEILYKEDEIEGIKLYESGIRSEEKKKRDHEKLERSRKREVLYSSRKRKEEIEKQE